MKTIHDASSGVRVHASVANMRRTETSTVRMQACKIREQRSQLTAVLMKLIKDGKSKHFVPCDNKMSFCSPAIIGCFFNTTKISPQSFSLVHNGVFI